MNRKMNSALMLSSGAYDIVNGPNLVGKHINIPKFLTGLFYLVLPFVAWWRFHSILLQWVMVAAIFGGVTQFFVSFENQLVATYKHRRPVTEEIVELKPTFVHVSYESILGDLSIFFSLFLTGLYITALMAGLFS